MQRPHIDRERPYTVGRLSQTCARCGWEDADLEREVTHCPACGETVSADCAIAFGGTEIEYRRRKNRFFIGQPGEQFKSTTIYEADFTDSIVFMLRHCTFWMDRD